MKMLKISFTFRILAVVVKLSNAIILLVKQAIGIGDTVNPQGTQTDRLSEVLLVLGGRSPTTRRVEIEREELEFGGLYGTELIVAVVTVKLLQLIPQHLLSKSPVFEVTSPRAYLFTDLLQLSFTPI